MSISIIVDNKVKFKVKGTLKNGEGVDKPFDFDLVCKRLDSDEIQSKRGEDGGFVYVDFLADVVEGWWGVKDAGGGVVPFTPEALTGLCKIPGVAALAFHAYLRENGAKEKN